MSKLVISLLILSFAKFSSCEGRSKRIIGGKDPLGLEGRDRWKPLVAVVTGWVFWCEGAWISPKWMVTATCIHLITKDPINIECLGVLKARIGHNACDLENDYISKFLPTKGENKDKCKNTIKVVSHITDPGDVVRIKKFFLHKNFETGGNHQTGDHLAAHDIALLLSDQEKSEGKVVGLASKPIDQAKYCRIGAWGTSNKENKYEAGTKHVLKELNVTALDQSRWRAALEAAYQIAPSMSKAVLDYKLCVESSDKKQMAWKDDYGSPLICDNELQGFMTTPLATGQNEYVGIYVKLCCYYPWLYETVRWIYEDPDELKIPTTDFSKECIKISSEDGPTKASVKALRFNQLYLPLIFFCTFLLK